MKRTSATSYRAYRARRKAVTVVEIAPTPEVSLCRQPTREGFRHFCSYVTRNLPDDAKCIPQPHHLEWHQHLITEVDSKALIACAGQNVDILAPRGSAKSTTLALYVAWLIGIHTRNKLTFQVLYISANLQMARDKSAAIKDLILTPEYFEIFPEVKKGKKWADNYWGIDRKHAGVKSVGEEFTLLAAGIGGTIVSKRCHLVVLDDLIKSPDDIANPSVREKMKRNWNAAIRPTIFEGGRAVCVGTRYRPDDIHTDTFIAANKWLQVEQKAIVTTATGEERSYWENFWSLDYLKEQQRIDPISFQYQYQNEVGRISDISIDPAWIRYGTPPEEFDFLALGVDLAASLKEKADFTAMVLIGKKGHSYWVLDYRRGKWVGNTQKCDTLLELYEEWQSEGTPFYLYVEKVAYQASFKGDFTSYVTNELGIYDIYCYPSQMKGDKLAHLLSVSGLYANGLVVYNQFKDLSYPIEEMTKFGAMAHDDCMDATVLALQGLGSRARLLTA